MKNNLPKITLKRDVVKNIDSIQMYFKYNDELLNIIRGLKGFKWSSSIRCWHGEFNQNNLNLIRQTFKDIVILIDDNSLYTAPKIKRIKVNRKLSEENSVVMDSFIKYLEGRRYSRSTIETYAIFIGDFLEYLKKKSITNTTNRDVELFIEDVFIP
ncbi:phage integrase N-terminal SAM-like domain-containing protein, partial [Lutibacter citreus]|uniref:phage integrase N-terminal SAM-like domain-containing protein n=1 Tax=Lutibacter citreus TaxID=2138210 RepID=UPI0015CFD042